VRSNAAANTPVEFRGIERLAGVEADTVTITGGRSPSVATLASGVVSVAASCAAASESWTSEDASFASPGELSVVTTSVAVSERGLASRSSCVVGGALLPLTTAAHPKVLAMIMVMMKRTRLILYLPFR
jgi:hypothetical protein